LDPEAEWIHTWGVEVALVIGIWKRTWSYSLAVAAGCALELAGQFSLPSNFLTPTDLL